MKVETLRLELKANSIGPKKSRESLQNAVIRAVSKNIRALYAGKRHTCSKLLIKEAVAWNYETEH